MSQQLERHHQALLKLLDEFGRICGQLNIPYMLFGGSMLGAVRHKGFIPWDDDLDVILLREDYERLLAEAPALLGEEFFLQREFTEHWPMQFSKLRLNGTTCLEKYHPKDLETHQGIYIDIFPCDNASDHWIIRFLQFLSSKVVIAKCLDNRGYDTNSFLKKSFMKICTVLPLEPFWRFTAMEGRTDTGWVHCCFGGAMHFSRCVFPRSCIGNQIRMDFEGKAYPISKEYDHLLSILYGDYMRLPSPEDRKCKQHALLVDPNHPYTDYLHYRDGIVFDCYTRSIR